MVKAARNINLKILTGMILVVTLAYNSCTYDKGENAAPKGQCDTTQYAYTMAGIDTIIQTNCAIQTCHDAQAAANGLDLTSYSTLMAGGNSGAAVVPGNRNSSLLWNYVNNGAMPPAPDTLLATDIELIGKWIDEGACE